MAAESHLPAPAISAPPGGELATRRGALGRLVPRISSSWSPGPVDLRLEAPGPGPADLVELAAIMMAGADYVR
jgi:hypothetical protein